MKDRAVFLDRDGTLIQNHHFGCDPNAIEFLPGVVDGLRALRGAGYRLIVATNQSGVARGYFTERQLAAMHDRLRALLQERGVELDAIYYCPHHPDARLSAYRLRCECRKPKPGMLLRASGEQGVVLGASWMVGDILDDVEAGRAAGCRSVLIDVGTEGPPDSPARTPNVIARDFADAVDRIIALDQPVTVARTCRQIP